MGRAGVHRRAISGTSRGLRQSAASAVAAKASRTISTVQSCRKAVLKADLGLLLLFVKVTADLNLVVAPQALPLDCNVHDALLVQLLVLASRCWGAKVTFRDLNCNLVSLDRIMSRRSRCKPEVSGISSSFCCWLCKVQSTLRAPPR